MATYDTLEYAGNEQSFAGWSFALDVTDELGNQRADVFTATILGVDLATETDSPTFPFEAPIIVRTNRTSSTGAANSFTGGTITFSGKRVGNPTRATGNYEGVTYKFQGPWYDLMNTHFQQLFYGSGSTTFLLPELVLNSSTAVTSGQIMISVGDQIQAILQWLLDQYAAQGFAAPYQYIGRALHAGAIDLNSTGGVYNYLVDPATTTIEYSLFGLFLPSYIAKPMMCADAIQQCLKLSPRVTISFDYSTSPPTFYAALVDNMTPATLALFDGVSHKSLNIQSRNDLLVRCVNLVYRITNQIDHKPVVDYAQDKWGAHGSNSGSDPDTGLRVVVELIDLQGVNNTSTTAHLDVEPVLATADGGGTTQALKRTWWAYDRGGGAKQLLDSHVRFQDKTGSGTSIPDAVISDPSTQPATVLTTADLIAAGLCDIDGNLVLNRIVNGSAHTWMVNSDGSAVVSKKIHVSALMTYAEYDYPSSSGTPDTDTTGHSTTKNYTHEHHADFNVTNGTTGTYTALASTTPGETFIIGTGGIAEYLYNHMNVLQFEGEYAKVEVVFGTEVTLRNSINFSGGATTWTAMNAQPQSIRRNYGKKTTEVQIGVAKHLNSGQLSALLNMWRYRRTWYNPQVRTQNTLANSSNVDQAKSTNDANTPAGLVNSAQNSSFSYTTLPDPSTSTPGVINAGVVNSPSRIAAGDALN